MDQADVRPMRSVLIANRGEIARRIQRTCRKLGLRTVAVYSDADARAPFVRDADEAFRIGPAPSAQSYLCREAIVAAAERSGADAVHPGYGFLSENADFARDVEEAGLVFVGPSAEVIASMGDKRRAKELAKKAGLPVIEGYEGADQDTASLVRQGRAMPFPILLKASAGGGGKGMRIVREAGQLEAAIESARREAEKAFGDGALLIERYIERPRHVELQIFGDRHGQVVHLHERECSVQRRYQKVVEESPSPAVDGPLRQRMGEAAVRLAQSLGYEGAGTVELILAPTGEFYFLEVNTRLQVEHPVTEAVSGLDLVELQLRVARGERLPFTQADIDARMSGAAIECRLYAEDPSREYLPQTGRVRAWSVPDVPFVRVDSDLEDGAEVGVHYDPMLAKLICVGDSRAQALDRMAYTLARTWALGLVTNRDLLLRVVSHPRFAEGTISTHFLDEHPELLAPPPAAEVERAAVAAALFAHGQRQVERRHLPTMRTGYRHQPVLLQRALFSHGGRPVEVAYRYEGQGHFSVRVDGGEAARFERVLLERARLDLIREGHRQRFEVALADTHAYVATTSASVTLHRVPRFERLDETSAADACVAPMPGKVIDVRVDSGATVAAGAVLLVMEAMKMEHPVAAPHAGTVRDLAVQIGDQVTEGQVLLTVEQPAAG